MRSIYGLLAAGLLCTTAAHAADVTKVTVESMKAANLEVVQQASSGGASALDFITRARAEIASADYASALDDLTQAEAQLQDLRQLNPSASLQDGIRAVQATLESGGAEAAHSQLAPISENLKVVDDYSMAVAEVKVETEKPAHIGVSAAKQHIANAMGHLKIKDIKRAKVELRQAYETAIYTEVDLPVAASAVTVNYALEALQDGAKEGYEKGYAKVADDHLAAAQSSAETIVTTAKRGVISTTATPEN